MPYLPDMAFFIAKRWTRNIYLNNALNFVIPLFVRNDKQSEHVDSRVQRFFTIHLNIEH